MPYRLTRRARHDIQGIFDQSIAEFGESQAWRYYQNLEQRLKLLASNPKIGRRREDLGPDIRAHPYESHIILYRLRQQDIVIVRVVHAHRDFKNIL